MKSPLYLLFLTIVLQSGCGQRPKTAPDLPFSDTSRKDHVRLFDPSFFTNKDTVDVGYPGQDTIRYSKSEFNSIVTNFPELYKYPPLHPDLTYYGATIEGKFDERVEFTSEVGQDYYYMLYAYFLREKDKGRELAGCRDTLIQIFQAINEVFGALNHGGTYFGHEYKRILGNVEYAIYRFSTDPQHFKKEYDIQGQKEKFIDGISRQVTDEISVDNDLISIDEKEKSRQQMFITLGKIDALITNDFYLNQTRAFLYNYYDVY